MDKYIDGRFERLEKALTSLIDSVTKYHPSTAQARELEIADAELTKGLDRVQTHQNNHLRIQQLRESSAALDSQIRETLSSLATTRKDIVSTQTTTFPDGPNYPIAYDELLQYARRISKTTMPPAGAINAFATPPEGQTPVPDSQSQAATPSAPNSSQVQSPAIMNGASMTSEPATQQTTASANTILPEHMSQYLNPLSGQLFFPWPLEDKIRSGALASNQILVEQGINPKGYDPVEEEERKQREEEERKEREEKERLEREAEEKRLREEREKLRLEREKQRELKAEEWRRASIAGGIAAPAAPGVNRTNTAASEKKQFQFTSLDDLDDDDED